MKTKADIISGVVVKISVIVIAVFAILAAARFLFGGPEDSWICSGGQWVMHGKPATPKPTTPCLK